MAPAARPSVRETRPLTRAPWGSTHLEACDSGRCLTTIAAPLLFFDPAPPTAWLTADRCRRNRERHASQMPIRSVGTNRTGCDASSAFGLPSLLDTIG